MPTHSHHIELTVDGDLNPFCRYYYNYFLKRYGHGEGLVVDLRLARVGSEGPQRRTKPGEGTVEA